VPRDGINLKKNFCPCQAHIIHRPDNIE
jgi:hypothetical protein